MANYGKDMLDKLKFNKSRDGNDIILEQTQGTYIGSAIGLFCGLYIAHQRKSSLLMGAFVGAIIGGLATRTFIRKKD
jgi:hypothetical protein